jgi:UDP-glucose 4-epimerase
MKAFISGGAGFIGSHLVARMLRNRDVLSVVVFDNFSSGSLAHLKQSINDPRLSIVKGDIKDLGILTDAMRESDLVFHLAANPDIAKAVTQPDIDFWEGTYLTQNILEAMRINQVSKIFYTSGSGVYGEAPEIAFKESFGPCIPISTYGASKLACEALIASYCHMFSMTARVFRFANVVGPRQTHGVGYDFIRRLQLDPTCLQILGDGTQCKSYIHVDDVIAAMMLVLDQSNHSPIYDLFNVATDDYITVTEIADIASHITGLKKQNIIYQYSGGDRGWKGDVPQVLFDVAKIKSLGWLARRSARQAMITSLEAMKHEITP